MSIGGAAPSIIAVIASADPGAIDNPTCWCPKLNHSPSCRGAGPITGSESTIVGRRPIQGVSSISPFISCPSRASATERLIWL